MHALRAARRGGRAHARQGALRNPGGYGDAPALAGGGLPRRPVSMSTGNLAELYEAAQAGRGGGGAGAGLAGLRGVASSSNLWDQQAGARAGAGAGLGFRLQHGSCEAVRVVGPGCSVALRGSGRCRRFVWRHCLMLLSMSRPPASSRPAFSASAARRRGARAPAEVLA